MSDDDSSVVSKAPKFRNVDGLLSKNLGPEYISYRQGWNGTRIGYVEGWAVIALANKIFGYDGWSSEIKNVTVDFYDEVKGKIRVGISVVVRISLKSGCFKEDVGFGSCENQVSKVTAWEKARKEAVTDAIKRALRQFGNALGNCCYDKNYLRHIQAEYARGNYKRKDYETLTLDDVDRAFSVFKADYE